SGGLEVKQLTLALDAPSIAGKVAVGPHHAVTRDRDRQRVGGAGLSDRAHGPRTADRFSDLGVSGRPTRRDGAERLPDPLLESGAADVKWKVQALAGRLHQADDLRDRPLERGLAALKLGAR